MAKEFKEVKEIEAKHYVLRHGDYAYQNYLRNDRAQLKESGWQSMITAYRFFIA